MMLFRWFKSQTVRHACTVHKHYRRLLAAHRDLLKPEAIAEVQLKLDELSAAIREGTYGQINIKTDELQFAAEKNIKAYPHAAWRENVEVLLVALAVAMAIRTFFIQPFKIPTGSMQPTLFGVTSKNYLAPDGDPNFKVPTGWERVKEWFEGVSYVDVVAKNDGLIDFETMKPAVGIKLIDFYQTFQLGGQDYTVWFPPDYGEGPFNWPHGLSLLAYRAGLDPNHYYHKGEPVIKLRMAAGDHLFVDRMTYNFRKPERGEIIVFATAGITNNDVFGVNQMPQDQFYIKRLTVLPGEKVQIGDDRHLRINGKRLDASTPHFENVYGFNPDKAPRDSQFSGHVNGLVAKEYNVYPGIAPNFPNGETLFTNGPDSFMVFGDNTCNSSDSRTWGPFPTKNVIGKAFFVYWPLTDRFGIGTTLK